MPTTSYGESINGEWKSESLVRRVRFSDNLVHATGLVTHLIAAASLVAYERARLCDCETVAGTYSHKPEDSDVADDPKGLTCFACMEILY